MDAPVVGINHRIPRPSCILYGGSTGNMHISVIACGDYVMDMSEPTVAYIKSCR